MKTVLIIEHQIVTKTGVRLPPVLISARDYGEEIVADLTDGKLEFPVQTVDGLEGRDPKTGEAVTYSRSFVVLP